ncbi:MAG: hypothetical protein E7057_03660 [Lentisphaerae bacterium]|nr:hypothetical protein [Lentisphaerota bacterium]
MNRFRNMTLILVLLLITCGALFGIRQLEYSLDRTINEEKLRFSGTVNDAPPAVVFTTMALGSFRGLLADVLWLRSEMLKSKKNYFEMVQLARWITDLQPNYSGGTAYLAWNLAYNISVTSSDWEDRWYWVNEGLKLIRDKALLYNPDDPMLYKELSWIYLHKLGNLMDDAHLYYKNQMAIQMTNILGKAMELEPLAAAPAGKAEFMRLYPENSKLWDKIRKAGFKDYEELTAAFRKPVRVALPEELGKYLTKDEMALLDAHLRAELLRERLKLDPVKMLAIDRKYGKMDWRVPESQAIYWAEVGVDKSVANGRRPDVNCVRIVTHGLQAAFRSGKLVMIDDDARTIQALPNLNLTDSAYKAFESAEGDYKDSGAGDSFYSAKINYLKDAIPLIYLNGDLKKAQEFYDRLVKMDGKYFRSMDEFVMAHFAEDVRDADVERANSIVSSLIMRALENLLRGDRQSALANERLAKFIHKEYVRKNKDVKRNQLPAYEQIKSNIFQGMLNYLRENRPEWARKLEAEAEAERAEKLMQKNFENKGDRSDVIL